MMNPFQQVIINCLAEKHQSCSGAGGAAAAARGRRATARPALVPHFARSPRECFFTAAAAAAAPSATDLIPQSKIMQMQTERFENSNRKFHLIEMQARHNVGPCVGTKGTVGAIITSGEIFEKIIAAKLVAKVCKIWLIIEV